MLLPSLCCIPLHWNNFSNLECRRRIPSWGSHFNGGSFPFLLHIDHLLISVGSHCLIPFPSFSLAPEVASASFSLCFASFAQLSFSSHRPIKMCSHPTSLERKLDVEEKRDTYAYNWWKRRPLRKIWLWNDLTFTDVTSACEVSIVDWYARFQFAEGKGGSCSMKKIKC